MEIGHIEEDNMRKLKYGDGTISERKRLHKDGTTKTYYQARILINGERKTIYADTKTECQNKLCTLRQERDAELKAAKTPHKQLNTYANWLDKWVLEFKENELRSDYLTELKRKVEIIKKEFGNVSLQKITSMQIQEYINSLPRKNTTVKTYDVINGSLQKAEDFGLIKKNPCKAVKRPTYKKQKRRPFELAEQCEIMELLSERYSKLFFFLCCTGLRIGEFLALTHNCIDWQRNVIHVTNSLNSRTGTLSATKTEAGVRNVIFEGSLFDEFNLDDYKDITYNAIKKAFEKVFNKLGLTDISVTHSCRHTYASIMHALGLNDKILQRQMGHASMSTTTEVYTDILMAGDSPILDYCRKLKAEIEKHLL